MRIAVFTSNRPRHIALIEGLASVADEVVAVQECSTVFPGRVADFYKKSDVMQQYFARVIAAEETVFGGLRFAPPGARTLSIRSGDLNMMQPDALAEALSCDLQIVFGSSYIKGWLIDALVERNAINIHMGTSPYYRGSSCNFWALYDGNADLVGATIHRLSKGLDSGAMLFHALPPREPQDPFTLGMMAVRAAQQGLMRSIADGRILDIEPVMQDRDHEIRYTRNADFTDEIAAEYLQRGLTAEDIGAKLRQGDSRPFLNPFYCEFDDALTADKGGCR